jgi:hypothetical protein
VVEMRKIGSELQTLGIMIHHTIDQLSDGGDLASVRRELEILLIRAELRVKEGRHECAREGRVQ